MAELGVSTEITEEHSVKYLGLAKLLVEAWIILLMQQEEDMDRLQLSDC